MQTSSGPAAARGTALVRFIDAEPAIDEADLIFADRLEFSGVVHKSVNPHKELAGRHGNFRLRGTGMSNDPAKSGEALNDGRHHTVIAMRKADNTPILRAFDDELDPPASGKAKLRFINASPEEGELALSIAGNNRPLFAGMNFWADGGDKKTTAMRVRNQTLEAGKTYTVIALGDGKKELLFIEDRLLEKSAAAR